MKRILVDVDTQHDFARPGGALHTPAPPGTIEAIARELQAAQRDGEPIIGSVDSHAYDAWEFRGNGGPFAPHCIKGTPGWLRVHHDLPPHTRFVAMQARPYVVANLVGEAVKGQGNRLLGASALAAEALGGVGIYFEKEVYSLFANPVAQPVVTALVEALGGADAVRFDVLGYCTGGYCVDAAAKGLLERGYAVRVLAHATAAIGGPVGRRRSQSELTALGVEWSER